jgi:hypothetical protein
VFEIVLSLFIIILFLLIQHTLATDSNFLTSLGKLANNHGGVVSTAQAGIVNNLAQENSVQLYTARKTSLTKALCELLLKADGRTVRDETHDLLL